MAPTQPGKSTCRCRRACRSATPSCNSTGNTCAPTAGAPPSCCPLDGHPVAARSPTDERRRSQDRARRRRLRRGRAASSALDVAWSSYHARQTCDEKTIGNSYEIDDQSRLTFRYDGAAVRDLATAWTALPATPVLLVAGKRLSEESYDAAWRIGLALRQAGKRPVIQSLPAVGETVDLRGLTVPGGLASLPVFAGAGRRRELHAAQPCRNRRAPAVAQRRESGPTSWSPTPRCSASSMPRSTRLGEQLRTAAPAAAGRLHGLAQPQRRDSRPSSTPTSCSSSPSPIARSSPWRRRPPPRPPSCSMRCGARRRSCRRSCCAPPTGRRSIRRSSRCRASAARRPASRCWSAATGPPRSISACWVRAVGCLSNWWSTSRSRQVPARRRRSSRCSSTITCWARGASTFPTDRRQRISARIPRYALDRRNHAARLGAASAGARRLPRGAQGLSGLHPADQPHPPRGRSAEQRRLHRRAAAPGRQGPGHRAAVVPASTRRPASPRVIQLADASAVLPDRAKLTLSVAGPVKPDSTFLALDAPIEDVKQKVTVEGDRMKLVSSDRTLFDVSGLDRIGVIELASSAGQAGITYRTVGRDAPDFKVPFRLSRGDIVVVGSSGPLAEIDSRDPSRSRPPIRTRGGRRRGTMLSRVQMTWLIGAAALLIVDLCASAASCGARAAPHQVGLNGGAGLRWRSTGPTCWRTTTHSSSRSPSSSMLRHHAVQLRRSVHRCLVLDPRRRRAPSP